MDTVAGDKRVSVEDVTAVAYIYLRCREKVADKTHDVAPGNTAEKSKRVKEAFVDMKMLSRSTR